jgi:hypothetical protein
VAENQAGAEQSQRAWQRRSRPAKPDDDGSRQDFGVARPDAGAVGVSLGNMMSVFSSMLTEGVVRGDLGFAAF